ncbi:hypothetical protein evm_003968 [Chilo suppressalis]|nr:hypothetical protein evm_003968 [Chilo suppressalis]
MGLNAKEVVRVYACSTQLSQNLSGAKFEVMGEPFTTAVLGLRPDISQIKDTIKSIRDVILPIEIEIEDYKERRRSSYEISSQQYRKTPKVSDEELLQKLYLMKLERRCEDLIERAVAFCANLFTSTYQQCLDEVGTASSWVLCRPLKLCHICDLKDLMGYNICDATNQTNPGLGKGYIALKKAKNIVTSNREVLLQYKIETIHQLYNVQDAKETGDRVMHAFEEKYIVMHSVITAVNLCVALLFLRIFTAAVAYHDQYLTNIEYDNVYITGRFKKIDRKRRRRHQFALLPLKKSSERDNLVTHILKVLLEVVTATTFVMLDRLFYEALDVVRQHAEMELPTAGTRDLEIEVEGTGTLASMVRTVLGGLNVQIHSKHNVSNHLCLPHPRVIPFSFYLNIYGGYLWILLLLYIDPYTVRLRSLVCGFFYPNREKQRLLHLYNDILKKRMKMEKTVRRKAIQAVRAHYLSGENLLSLRIKFPRLLGWLRVFPAARMTCLICGETEPREHDQKQNIEDDAWRSCTIIKCPFVYCLECWREVGARCLACDPSLAELSDMDSLSEDDLKY